MIWAGIIRDTPLTIFGAGATKDSGGPLTNEILHEVFQAGPSLIAQQNAVQLLQQFLQENFPERGMQQYIVVGALLAIDEHLEPRDVASVAFIWNHIWGDEGLTDVAKDDSVSTLTDILLDQYFVSGPSRYTRGGLAQQKNANHGSAPEPK